MTLSIGSKTEKEISLTEILKKPVGLYHSKDDNYGKGLKSFAISFVIVSIVLAVFLVINYYLNKNINLDSCYNNLCWYFLGESLWLGILSFISYKYIYGEKNRRGFLRIIGIIIYYLLLLLTIISLIPVFITFGIVLIVISYRAKKVENLINVWLIFFLDIFIIGALGWAEIQSAFIEYLVTKVCIYVELNDVTTELFIFLATSEILIIFVNKIVFYAIYGKRKKFQRKMIKEIKDNARKSFKSGDDISLYNQNIENEISDFKEKDENDIDYEIKYLKKTLLKMQLFSLIIIGFLAIFWNGEPFKGINTEIINVVTCFSLIILYIDKRESLGKIQE